MTLYFRKYNKKGAYIKMKKRMLAGFLAVALMLSSIAGCQPSSEQDQTQGETTETKIFTDSTGREVEVPKKIERVAVSGAIASMVILAFAPEMMVGLSGSTAKDVEQYFPESYLELPVLGQLYGGTSELNLEELMLAAPQVIIDIGTAKNSTKEDMDKITDQTGIPAVHVHYTMAEAGDTFRMLGELLGVEERGEEYATYCETVYDRAVDIANKVEKKDLLYVLGIDGYSVIATGSYQSELIDLMSNNLAVVDNPSSKGTGNTVEMEQLLVWDPEVIIFSAEGLYDQVANDPAWQQMKAIQNGTYYEVPFGPYNWMGFPPSVQRYLGLLWMAELLYPEAVEYDLREEVKTYYNMFYHKELTDAQYDQLVAKSLGK